MPISNMEAFQKDRDAVMARAWEAGLKAIITVGAGDYFSSNERAIRYAHTEERIFATVGIHPHCAKDIEPDWLHN